ncbi:hypothetical protein [Streptomyces griseomycini]|uniref:Uncharacterized protein n=1 Tax=Streptomyces griseomycini TaxID=66895 RepID=A0A7W7VA38_9ACTN|nr:hypothetical protein [Streptomyces griseomycini]MBB4902550.1 hypothetical protein [Streptomyces griseomycini]GGR52338.1 hypothetical protein GCM10015536_67420 [Streptomyces griseomycini]
MTTAVEAPDTADLEQLIALIACGRTRPGKTKACDRCAKRGRALLEFAALGTIDALAAAICRSEVRRSCAPCVEKALEIISVYNEGAQ